MCVSISHDIRDLSSFDNFSWVLVVTVYGSSLRHLYECSDHASHVSNIDRECRFLCKVAKNFEMQRNKSV